MNYIGESTPLALLLLFLVIMLIVVVSWRRRKRPTTGAISGSAVAMESLTPSPIFPPVGSTTTADATPILAHITTRTAAPAIESTAEAIQALPTQTTTDFAASAGSPADDHQPPATPATEVRGPLVPLTLPLGPLAKRAELGKVSVHPLRGSLR